MPTQQRGMLWAPPPFVPGRFQTSDGGQSANASNTPSDRLAEAGQQPPSDAATASETSPRETGDAALLAAERSLWSKGVQEQLQAQQLSPLRSIRGVWRFKDAFKNYFGDDAEIEYDGSRITVKTPKGAYVFGIAFGQTKRGEKTASLVYYKDGEQPIVIGRIFPYNKSFYVYSKDFRKIGYKKNEVVKTENPPKPKPKWKKAALIGAGGLATVGLLYGGARALGGGGDDDDESSNNQNRNTQEQGTTETISLGGFLPAPSVEGQDVAKQDTANQDAAKQDVAKQDATKQDLPRSSKPETKPPQVIVREIISGAAPVQVARKENETQVRAETSAGIYGLNIGTTDTLILRDEKVVGKVPTADVIAAVEQLRAGKTERELKKSGMFDELFKNPWFFVALALALVALTRRR